MPNKDAYLIDMDSLYEDALILLRELIGTPSLSREENETADILCAFLDFRHIPFQRQGHNVWARNKYWKEGLPVILLNSHHDTVKPAAGWVRSPFYPSIEDGKLYGLGSNDAGGPLVALLSAFCHFFEQENLPFNLIWAGTAEEEISGPNGIASILPALGPIAVGIVGEPTLLKMAIAEKGLMVVDAEAKGKAGHAAREEGVNAIYIALEDVAWIRQHRFEQESPLLGPVKMTVTQIDAGTQHNVVPDTCKYVIDIRSNECYSNQEIFEYLQQQLASQLNARSFRLNSSHIPLDHPLVQRGLSLGLEYFGSPTLSDQALMAFPTLKIGPGDSARSHTADEYIRLDELRQGIEIYIKLLNGLIITTSPD